MKPWGSCRHSAYEPWHWLSPFSSLPALRLATNIWQTCPVHLPAHWIIIFTSTRCLRYGFRFISINIINILHVQCWILYSCCYKLPLHLLQVLYKLFRHHVTQTCVHLCTTKYSDSAFITELTHVFFIYLCNVRTISKIICYLYKNRIT